MSIEPVPTGVPTLTASQIARMPVRTGEIRREHLDDLRSMLRVEFAADWVLLRALRPIWNLPSQGRTDADDLHLFRMALSIYWATEVFTACRILMEEGQPFRPGPGEVRQRILRRRKMEHGEQYLSGWGVPTPQFLVWMARAPHPGAGEFARDVYHRVRLPEAEPEIPPDLVHPRGERVESDPE